MQLRGVEPGCLLVNPSCTRAYPCKLLLTAIGLEHHRVALLVPAPGGTDTVGDWALRDDPGGLAAEITCWP